MSNRNAARSESQSNFSWDECAHFRCDTANLQRLIHARSTAELTTIFKCRAYEPMMRCPAARRRGQTAFASCSARPSARLPRPTARPKPLELRASVLVAAVTVCFDHPEHTRSNIRPEPPGCLACASRGQRSEIPDQLTTLLRRCARPASQPCGDRSTTWLTRNRQ